MTALSAVLFDIYGTIVDIETESYRDDVFDALSRYLQFRSVVIDGHAFKERYFAVVDEQLRTSTEEHPEMNALEAFARVLAERGAGGDRELATQIAQLHRALCRRRFGLFSDTIPALEAFAGKFRIGIVSDAQRIYCEPELAALDLLHRFETMVISVDHGFRKPDPRMFTMATDALGVSPAETAYIGDTYYNDVVGPRNAGLAAACLIRQSDEKRRALPPDTGPDVLCDDLWGALEALAG